MKNITFRQYFPLSWMTVRITKVTRVIGVIKAAGSEASVQYRRLGAVSVYIS